MSVCVAGFSIVEYSSAISFNNKLLLTECSLFYVRKPFYILNAPILIVIHRYGVQYAPPFNVTFVLNTSSCFAVNIHNRIKTADDLYMDAPWPNMSIIFTFQDVTDKGCTHGIPCGYRGITWRGSGALYSFSLFILKPVCVSLSYKSPSFIMTAGPRHWFPYIHIHPCIHTVDYNASVGELFKYCKHEHQHINTIKLSHYFSYTWIRPYKGQEYCTYPILKTSCSFFYDSQYIKSNTHWWWFKLVYDSFRQDSMSTTNERKQCARTWSYNKKQYTFMKYIIDKYPLGYVKKVGLLYSVIKRERRFSQLRQTKVYNVSGSISLLELWYIMAHCHYHQRDAFDALYIIEIETHDHADM